MYTPHYPADVACALAEEFGSEARVLHAMVVHHRRGSSSCSDAVAHAWTLTLAALTAKAAHFAAMHLDATKETR